MAHSLQSVCRAARARVECILLRVGMPIRKICILGLDDYAMLAGEVDAAAGGYIGGESVQHVLLAKAWREMGLEVSIVVYDHGQPRVCAFDGIRAIAAFKPDAGIPVLRFVHPRLTKVLAAMREADADVYYQSPSSMYTGLVAWFAQRHGRKSVVRIASDLGCIPGRQLIRYRRDRWLYEYGLRHATLLAAQTSSQRRLLQRHYGLESPVVNMAIEIPARGASQTQDIDVLWLANPRPVKRPEILLELARRLPHCRFAVAGGPLPGAEVYFNDFAHAARQLPNVQLLGPVPYRQTGALFERARLHINTSSAEGFPNTFLQAWARGVPVVSFFDPDGLIRRRCLGRAVLDVNEMAVAIPSLLQDDMRRRAMGARARMFVQSEFRAGEVARRYLELLEDQPGRQWVQSAGGEPQLAQERAHV